MESSGTHGMECAIMQESCQLEHRPGAVPLAHSALI